MVRKKGIPLGVNVNLPYVAMSAGSRCRFNALLIRLLQFSQAKLHIRTCGIQQKSVGT